MQVDRRGQYFTQVGSKGQGLTLQSPLYLDIWKQDMEHLQTWMDAQRDEERLRK